MAGRNGGVMITFMPRSAKGPPPERITVDGVVLKVGDVVWRASVNYGSLTRSKVTRDVLRYWGRYDGTVYASKRAAAEAVLSGAQKRLKRAKQDVRRETKTIARYKALLTAMAASSEDGYTRTRLSGTTPL